MKGWVVRIMAIFHSTSIMSCRSRYILILFTGMGFIALSAPVLAAQSDSTFEIRVEAREVVVPVYVDYKNLTDSKGMAALKTPNIPMDLEESGLAARDFHIFEDGAEQPVKHLSIVPLRFWRIKDNAGVSVLRRVEEEFNYDIAKIMSTQARVVPLRLTGTYSYAHCSGFSHMEYSGTPYGFWSGPDSCFGEEHIPIPDAKEFSGWLISDPYKDGDSGQLHLYFISYVPPPSVEGSCHQIKIVVDRKDANVYARNQYCNIHNSPSDPLKGTKVGEYMETYNASAQKDTFPLTVQAVVTFNDADASRVNIAVEFPWRALSAYWDGMYRAADVDLLCLVYNQGGTLATRFSDVAYSPKILEFHKANRLWENRDISPREDTDFRLPTRYEAQIYLPTGNYKIRIVLTDGKNFGSAELPLTVESYDPKSLSVSGIVLSKRFTKMAVEWPKYIQGKKIADQMKIPDSEGSTAPEYVPLVSNGMGITPTGDTHFHAGDLFLSYFEVYEPMLTSGQTKVQTETRVIDAKTGQTIVDTGLRSAESNVNPGKLIIPIIQVIAIDKLPVGAYRVEVQASDSTGKQTPWRSASFTVE